MNQRSHAGLLTRPMLTRRSIIFGAACAAFAAPATAADAAALAFVTSIYDAYKGKDSKGVLLDNARTVRRYFEPSLAALINNDRAIAARRGEVGLLDGDPFIDAQDWDISTFAIVVSDITPGKAVATVKFTSLGRPSTVLLDLVKIKNDWRIGNITWLRDGKPQSLRSIYAH